MNRKLPDKVIAAIKKHSPALIKARAELYKAQEAMFKDVAEPLGYEDGGSLFETFSLPDTDDVTKLSAAIARYVLRSELDMDAALINCDLEEINREERGTV